MTGDPTGMMAAPPPPSPHLPAAEGQGQVQGGGSVLTPMQNYTEHKTTLRDMVATDHFSGTVPDSIVDLWMEALDPESRLALPPGVKGFYGSDLRASIPIELAHDAYKYVMHETDQVTIDKYANRMLVAISLLDLDRLSDQDPNLAGLALWHKALALARLPHGAEALADTLTKYEVLRPRASLPDGKLPQPGRLKVRLLGAARDLGLDETIAWLEQWQPEDSH